MEYIEDLNTTGVTCSPLDAFHPDGEKLYFRVIKNNRPMEDSFSPNQLKAEDRERIDPCIAKSLSLSDSFEGLLSSYFRAPAHKKKQVLVGSLKLLPKDGMLKQTFSAGHHSWWRSKLFELSSTVLQTIER